MPKQGVSKPAAVPSSIRFKTNDDKRLVAFAAMLSQMPRQDYIAMAVVERARQDIIAANLDPDAILASRAMANVA